MTAVSPPVILEEDDSPTKDLEFARRLPFHRHHEERKARRNDLELIGLVVLDSDVGNEGLFVLDPSAVNGLKDGRRNELRLILPPVIMRRVVGYSRFQLVW